MESGRRPRDIGILDELQAAQDAAIAIEPPVQENPEPETDIPPDPAISVDARNAYGYTDDAMLADKRTCYGAV